MLLPTNPGAAVEPARPRVESRATISGLVSRMGQGPLSGEGGAGVAVPLTCRGVWNAISATGCTRLGNRHQLPFRFRAADTTPHNLRLRTTACHSRLGGSCNSPFRGVQPVKNLGGTMSKAPGVPRKISNWRGEVYWTMVWVARS